MCPADDEDEEGVEVIPGAGFIRGLEPLPARGGPGERGLSSHCWKSPAFLSAQPFAAVVLLSHVLTIRARWPAQWHNEERPAAGACEGVERAERSPGISPLPHRPPSAAHIRHLTLLMHLQSCMDKIIQQPSVCHSTAACLIHGRTAGRDTDGVPGAAGQAARPEEDQADHPAAGCAPLFWTDRPHYNAPVAWTLHATDMHVAPTITPSPNRAKSDALRPAVHVQSCLGMDRDLTPSRARVPHQRGW